MLALIPIVGRMLPEGGLNGTSDYFLNG